MGDISVQHVILAWYCLHFTSGVEHTTSQLQNPVTFRLPSLLSFAFWHHSTPCTGRHTLTAAQLRSTVFIMKTFILTLALPLAGNIFASASDPSTVNWLTPTTNNKTPKHLPTEAACNKKLYCGDKEASCGYDLCGCAACCPDNAVCTGCIKSMIYVCVYLSSANMSTDYRTEPWSCQQLPRDHSNHQTRR